MSAGTTLPPISSPDGDQARAIAQLPENLAVIKLQHEGCMALAKAEPRNLVAIAQNLKQQLAAFPTFAAIAVYNKPVGREANRCGKCNAEFTNHKHRDCGNCKTDGKPTRNVELFDDHKLPKGAVEIKLGPMKFAEGLSIHAAEAIAEAYKYNAIDTTAESKDEQFASISATFVDMQSGRMRRATKDVPKHMTYRNGQQYKIQDDRFWGTVIQAELSKLLREVILRSIPGGLKAELFKAAKDAQETAMTDDEIDKMLLAFANDWGVSQRQLELFLGKPMPKWTSADRAKMGGVYQALRDDETTVAEMFEIMDEEPEETTKKKSGDGGAPADPAEMFKEIADNEFENVPVRRRAGAIKAALSLIVGEGKVDIDEAATKLRSLLAEMVKPADTEGKPTEKPSGKRKNGEPKTEQCNCGAPDGKPHDMDCPKYTAEANGELEQAEPTVPEVADGEEATPDDEQF